MIKRKNKILVLLILTVLTLANMNVAADTSQFYFDFSNGSSTDATKRTMKSGGAAYENFYYVTPTYFSAQMSYLITPYMIETESERFAVGYPQTIYANTVNVSKTYPYYKGNPAPYGKYYYLIGQRTDHSSPSRLYVEGRYTP